MTVSVIIPSRGRPETLLRAVTSCARGPVEIIVGLDDDDPTAPAARELLAFTPEVKVIVSPRHESLPALQNFLATHATGDFILPFTDDYTVEQEDWVARVADEVAKLPNGLGIVHLHDPIYPGFTTFPVIPRKLVELQGFLMAPMFPFLFTDTWWDEVGVLSGMKLQANATARLQQATGHDHRYRDLALWADLFDVLRPMRVNLALRMLEAVKGRIEPDIYEQIVGSMPQRAGRCAEFHARWTTPDQIARLEAMGTYEESPRYLAMKRKALDVLPQLKALKEAA